VAIELRLGVALPPIEADSGQMRQLLMSLLVNAGEAIGDSPGAITISTGARQITSAYLATTNLTPDLPSGQYVYLEVADTGRGMDAGTLARIFEPFFTTKFTGRGLELAAALGIVRGQRGALAVRSEPGRGSVFTIWLPSAAHRQPEAAAPPSERPASARGAVLVVEDDDSLRALTVRILEHFGFAVLTAADGQDGVAAFRAQADLIDCVLLDMHMPRMDGRQTLREILRIKHDARVVLMSGQDAHEIAQHFANLNLAGILQKPFSPDTLHAQIRQAIDRRLGVEDRS